MPQVIVKKRSEYSCEDCQDKGYVLQPSGEKQYKLHLDLSICHCTETKCVCDKTPPYMYHDEKSFQLKSCPCRRVRKTLDHIRALYKNRIYLLSICFIVYMHSTQIIRMTIAQKL